MHEENVRLLAAVVFQLAEADAIFAVRVIITQPFRDVVTTLKYNEPVIIESRRLLF